MVYSQSLLIALSHCVHINAHCPYAHIPWSVFCLLIMKSTHRASHCQKSWANFSISFCWSHKFPLLLSVFWFRLSSDIISIKLKYPIEMKIFQCDSKWVKWPSRVSHKSFSHAIGYRPERTLHNNRILFTLFVNSFKLTHNWALVRHSAIHSHPKWQHQRNTENHRHICIKYHEHNHDNHIYASE